MLKYFVTHRIIKKTETRDKSSFKYNLMKNIVQS